MDMVEFTILDDAQNILDTGIVSRAAAAFLMQTNLRPGQSMMIEALVATVNDADDLDDSFPLPDDRIN